MTIGPRGPARAAQLSFTATLQFLANTWLTAAVLPTLAPISCLQPLVQLKLDHGRSYRVVHRPDRIEPRVLKRRPILTPSSLPHASKPAPPSSANVRR